ncbi:MAG: histidinol dehydrogenase, partial [Alphaproteobacteria bacterium]|nr:histidinol dehydrogenase [Alphaproteobacteria bacterium]
MPWRLDATRPGFERAFRRLLSLKREASVEVDRVVGRILDDVKRRGDAAIIAYTKRFDRLALAPKTLRLSRREIAAGAAKAPKAQRRA